MTLPTPIRPLIRAVILLAALTACGPPHTQNPDENDIWAVLTQFQAAKNNRDLHALLPLLHPGGEFSFACGVRVSKTELARKLPGFWAELDRRKLGLVPLSHECLNGDYYPSGQLKDPVIAISGNEAMARVWFTKRLWSSLLLFVSLEKEAAGWRITRTEWGPS